MKTLFTSIFLTAVSVMINAQDRVVAENQLPKEIRTYVKTHFPKNAVLQATVDKDLMSKSYDVILKDNIKLEFNSKNKIKEIDGNTALPKSVIPAPISLYVLKNYPRQAITDWELDDTNQKIKLENGIELKFNKTGKFLRIDD